MTLEQKRNTKRNLSVLVLIASIAISTALFYNSTEATVIPPNFESTADGVVTRTVAPYLFELPEGSVDNVRYSTIRDGGLPEAVLQKSKVVSLPLIIRPTMNEEVKVDFYTTFGEQIDLPKMPPGVHVVLEPSSVTLKPGKDSQINLLVRVDKDAPDGLYLQHIVGKWGGPNDFSGTAISLKVGNGSPQFLLPGDVGQ